MNKILGVGWGGVGIGRFILNVKYRLSRYYSGGVCLVRVGFMDVMFYLV